MGASTVLPGGRPTLPPPEPGRSVGTDPAETFIDRYGRLSERMRQVCRSAVDTDEVAAYLEAGGVNDRIAARDFGVTSVFSLASRLRAEPVPARANPPGRAPEPALTGSDMLASAVRAALYLTPAIIAVGAAPQLSGLPPAAGAGALIFSWATSQALAFLGYRALGSAGPARAARLLACGFAAAMVGWAVVLFCYGVTEPRAYAVATGQVALFAATAVALVTGTERRVLVAAAGVWVSTALLSTGTAPGGVYLIGAAVAVMVLVAYLPAAGAAAEFRPRPADSGGALVYGAVGAGQAVLFASVVLAPDEPALVPASSVPLMVGVPLAELLLVWHKRRIANARAALTDRRLFQRSLDRVSAVTVAVLAVPVVLGAAAGLAGAGALSATVLLTVVFATCLVLAAHRRLGLAALVVWWPAVLIGALYRAVPHAPPELVHRLVAVVLFSVCVPALVVALLVLRDRWSYR